MSEEKKHILIVSQIFYPDQFRINDIAISLVNRGFKVTVLTGYPNYPEGVIPKEYKSHKVTKEKYLGIDIIRIPIIARGKNNKIKLVLNYASFPVSGYFWKNFSDIKADYVFIYEASPMTQALPGVWYAQKHNVPCYIYVTDLWPENVEAVANITNSFIIKQIGRMVDYIYKRCDRIFTPSKSFIDKIAERGVGREKLEYWPQYAEDFYYPIKKSEVLISEIPDDDILNLTFAGNIGYAQGLEILPELAFKLKKEREIVRFNIIGDGRYLEELKTRIHTNNVTEYFNFIKRQPAEKIKEYMTMSDASLVILSKNKLFELTIPAKVQSSLACGVPIMGSISGETKNIIESSNIGFCSNAGDVDGLYQNILKLKSLTTDEKQQLKTNAISYYKDNFNKEKLMDRMEYWLSR